MSTEWNHSLRYHTVLYSWRRILMLGLQVEPRNFLNERMFQ